MQAFDVYFLGEILPESNPADVRRQVARLFKVQDDAVERLFSGKPVRVKQAVDVDTASRYRALFRDAGALLQIVPSGGPPPQRQPMADNPPSDTAGAAAPAGMSLAEPGAIIDEKPAPPPAEIDTGNGVGDPTPRYRGHDQVLGEKTFVADMAVAGMLHGALVLSDHPRARVLEVDAEAAASATGVVRVLTAADVPGERPDDIDAEPRGAAATCPATEQLG